MSERLVWVGMTPYYHSKPYLSYDIEYDMYTLVINPKTDYRRIKKIMKAVKKRITAVEPNVNIKYEFRNFKNERREDK